jgi:hypothetical protein
MKDYGNDPYWQIDANGDKYARKLPTQPDERFYLYGPGSGNRRTDKFFDGLITALILAVGVTLMVGLLKVTAPAEAPISPDTGTVVCR